MRESYLEGKARAEVRKRGGRLWKWVSPGQRGVPDRILLMPGGVIRFVEFKRPGVADGRSAWQVRVSEILASLGFEVWLISSWEDFVDALDRL